MSPPKFQIGAIVRLNRKYFREGRRCFGNDLKYPGNFKRKVLAVHDLGADGHNYEIETIEDRIHESFLEKVKDAPHEN